MLKRNKVTIITIIVIFAFGFIMRLKSITSFYLYPDTYRYLLGAQNILDSKAVGSSEGIVHIGFSYLIALGSFITDNVETAARLVSFSAGVLTIPLIYYCAKKIFNSQNVGVLASLVFAGSFSHSTWSGFVLSETSAIFFLLLAWALLLREKPFLAGLAQVISISCRMEYALLVLPTLIFFLDFREKRGQLLRYLLGLGVPSLVFVSFIKFNNLFIDRIISYQLAIISSLIFSLLIFVLKGKRKANLTKITNLGLLMVLLYSLLLIPTRMMGGFFPSDLWILKAWGDFALSDPILVYLGVAGLALVVWKKGNLVFFFLASTVPLFLAYQRINPISSRYLVHLTPILAMASGYFIVKAYKSLTLAAKKIRPIVFRPAVSFIFSIFIFAILLPVKFVSAQWHPEENYEKLTAYRVQKIIEEYQLIDKASIITFSTDSYSFYTNLPTQKIEKAPPYFSLENVDPSSKMVLIVVDEAVRDQRSDFVDFAEESLKPYLVERSSINSNYFYANYSYFPDKPMEIYLIHIDELKISLPT